MINHIDLYFSRANNPNQSKILTNVMRSIIGGSTFELLDVFFRKETYLTYGNPCLIRPRANGTSIQIK